MRDSSNNPTVVLLTLFHPRQVDCSNLSCFIINSSISYKGPRAKRGFVLECAKRICSCSIQIQLLQKMIFINKMDSRNAWSLFKVFLFQQLKRCIVQSVGQNSFSKLKSKFCFLFVHNFSWKRKSAMYVWFIYREIIFVHRAAQWSEGSLVPIRPSQFEQLTVPNFDGYQTVR